jgi:PBP1b-binding outer membrane lipoprotein LpoB
MKKYLAIVVLVMMLVGCSSGTTSKDDGVHDTKSGFGSYCDYK